MMSPAPRLPYKPALDMRVPEECNFGDRKPETGLGVVNVKNVTVFVVRCAVDQVESFHLYRSVGQSRQPFCMTRSQLASGPEGRRLGDRIE